MSFEHEKARIHGEVIGAEAAIHSPVNAVDQFVVDKYCEKQKLQVRDHDTKEPKIVAMRSHASDTSEILQIIFYICTLVGAEVRGSGVIENVSSKYIMSE